ncbi:Uncharacterised protein [Helicobacter pylori]|uniref:Uncharacterized protein n=1 Tax=Helicobacter pylori TaxID=210 RepID=A0A377ITL4_HELPX|nr:hypothetical protein [Helicobacter pylori]MCQ2905726.1 hypothetical protein [Helicobacter pylori]MCQ2916707.1 hypothetical protein [Helicobacter pylori]STO83343.1 Uncharacterised protein [Helicobacter pylori]
MLLNYGFLEWVDDEPQRNTSLTASIDKALADKKLARQNKPSVRVKDNLSLRATLDAFGEELSRLKNQQETTIKASTIESTNLNSIVNKIKSGLPFGTISAFRVFKPAFEKDFTEKEREKLVEAYKSGYKASQLDKVAKKWNDDPNPIDASYLADAFLREYRTIALKLSTALGKSFVNKFLNPKSETTMRDLMSSDKFVKRYRYTQKDNMERTRQLKGLLDSKRDFIGYIQVLGYWKDNPKDNILPDKEVSFFVFQNEPSSTFDLKDHLQVWGAKFNQAAICYGGQMLANKNKTYRIDLISTSPGSYGKVWAKFTGIKFSVPSDLPQALTRINDSVYTFLSKYKGGLGINKIVKTELKATCMPFDYSKLGIETIGEEIRDNIKALQKITRGYGHPKEFFLDAMVERQEQAIKRIEARKCAVSDDYRQGMKRNILVSKIAKAMRQGKKASKTLIAKVLANTIDTDAGYCFISDLATQLDNISPRLSKSIVTAIEQAEGVRLLYALIDRVSYNSLHNTLNFIFDIDNPMSDQSLNELVIEVPREALKNVKLPQIKNVLTAQIFDGAYQFKS